MDGSQQHPRELLTFLVELGAAMDTTTQPVYVVQSRLTNVARAYGASMAAVSAFPTDLMVSIGRGEPTVLELTTTSTGSARLDQVAALDRLLELAERAELDPAEGLRRLEEVRSMEPRFGRLQAVAGYSLVAVGI